MGEFNNSGLAELEVLDCKKIRLCVEAHCKLPSEMLYLESGALPISSVISAKRLCYLQNILKRHDSEIVRKVCTAQNKNPSPVDWIHRVNEDLKTFTINMCEDDIIKLTECHLKSKI